MEKPEHWEPWWDDDEVELGLNWTHLINWLAIWGIILSALVYGFQHYLMETILLTTFLFISLAPLVQIILIAMALTGPKRLVFRGNEVLLKGTLRQRLGLARDGEPKIELMYYGGGASFFMLGVLLSKFPVPRIIFQKLVLLHPSSVPENGKRTRPRLLSIWLFRCPPHKLIPFLNYRIAKAHNAGPGSAAPAPSISSNRLAPPRGVEVMGDLASDAAWWDADHLVFPRLNVRFALLIMPIGIADLIMPFWVHFKIQALEQGPNVLQAFVIYGTLAQLFLCGLFLVGMPLTACFIPNQIVLRDNEMIVFDLDRTLFNLIRGRKAGARYRLSDIQRILPPVPPERLKIDPLRYIVRVEGGRVGAAHFGRPNILRLGGAAFRTDHFRSLLSYRIAKAKGENPPPPEFL